MAILSLFGGNYKYYFTLLLICWVHGIPNARRSHSKLVKLMEALYTERYARWYEGCNSQLFLMNLDTIMKLPVVYMHYKKRK